MNLTWDVISAANEQLTRWRTRINEWSESESEPMAQEYVDSFTESFFDDLNTPQAVNQLRNLERDPSISAGSKFETFIHLDSLLGLDLARDIGKRTEIPQEVQQLLNQRNLARENKDWAGSDQLRDAIAALGFSVKDTANGQEISPS
jgi:cysteinyl-tRNA synthetase